MLKAISDTQTLVIDATAALQFCAKVLVSGMANCTSMHNIFLLHCIPSRERRDDEVFNMMEMHVIEQVSGDLLIIPSSISPLGSKQWQIQNF